MKKFLTIIVLILLIIDCRQIAFTPEMVQQLATRHPEWKTQQPFKAVLENNRKVIAEFGVPELAILAMATFTEISPEAYKKMVADWLATIYQPMLEVIAYLRANDFKPFIMTEGGTEFVWAYSEEVYGIPPEEVVGSAIRTKFEVVSMQKDWNRVFPG